MRLTHFFIERPRFAVVLSAFVTLLGLGALAILPVAQYPEIVPPTVQITTVYPGASAETVARTVATPLEQQINGVENMLYMGSQSTRLCLRISRQFPSSRRHSAIVSCYVDEWSAFR